MLTETPLILLGMDARPKEDYARAKALGCNALHRLDPGPQKKDTTAVCVAAARALDLLYVVEGVVAEAEGYDMAAADPYLVAWAHPDEPDLNRADQIGKVPDAVLVKQIYYPVGSTVPGATPAPHPSCIGWTLPSVLAERYARWKAKAPNVPVLVNVNGQNLTSGYYADGRWHKPYFDASDAGSTDLHVDNAGGGNWPLYYLALAIDRLARWHRGGIRDCYIECSDEVLDDVEGGGPLRGPTPDEQSTQVWLALGHGIRRLWYFPQRIGKTGSKFAYWNIAPANADRMRADNAQVLWYQRLIATGRHSLTQTPAFVENTAKGTRTLPTVEVHTWWDDDQSLTVTLDLAGKTPPRVAYTGPRPFVAAAPPVVVPEVTDPRDKQVLDLTHALDEMTQARDNAKAALAETAALAQSLRDQLARAQQLLTDATTTLTARAAEVALLRQQADAGAAVTAGLAARLQQVAKSALALAALASGEAAA
jgi:hypothetical protein